MTALEQRIQPNHAARMVTTIQVYAETVKSTRQNISKFIDVKRTICRPGTEDSPFDSMRPTNCIGCNQKYLLRVDNPICVSCKGIY